jgi:membrane protease YdiL (CAAX protease family)
MREIPRTGPDAYRPDGRWRLALGVAALMLLSAVVFIQRPVPAAPGSKLQAAAGLSPHMSPSVEILLFTKLYFAVSSLIPQDSVAALVAKVDTIAEFPLEGSLPEPVGPPTKEPPIPPPAHTRVQGAIAAAEMRSAEAALARLDIVEPVLDPASPLVGDVALLRRIYGGEPVADVAAAMTESERDEFIGRHGLFGHLALSFEQQPSEVRAEAATSGMIIGLVLVFFGGSVFVAGAIGFGILIYFWVQINAGKLRPRFIEPDRIAAANIGPTSWGWGMDPQGRLVWLETVVVFLAGFLVLGVSGDVLAAQFAGQSWVMLYALLGQWVLVLTLFWPVARGMPWQRWRAELGWHRGTGFFNEVSAGLAAYLASLPIYFLVALLMVLLIMAAQSMGWDLTPSVEDNKLADLVSSTNVLVLVLFFTLATMWAPIVEESIFRGALYRHTRWRFSPAIAAIFTAFVFAIMHGYAPMQLFMVGTLGLVFAVMREWRGSLIGPMTAHFTHNFVVVVFAILVFSQVSN